ncbi:glycosyltransferase family 4 protein [Microbacterium azadirachtae]|uniref:glycosyltransferase family 4 protein n=1 Tax=Microbacterium azadirachtae TaxID=582680 RepID=UPI003F750BA6
MRIAFVVNNYPPKTGGVETHVHSLARHLRSLGHEIVVITLAERAGVAVEDGIEVVRMPEHLRVGDVLGFPSPGATRRIARLLEEHRIDAVSVHTRFFPMTWIGLRAGRRTGAAVVHTEHGSDHVVSPSALISTASRIVDRTLGRRVLRSADAVLGVSESVTAFVRRLSGREARVFYNAIDPSPSTEETGRPGGLDRLVFVGRLVAGKGADVFVDLVADLAATNPAIEAVMLGDGPDRGAIEDLVRRSGVQERVTLRGRVAPEEVRRELRGAILVNPTTLAEGFQTTLLEALDAGGRVATYDVPGAALLQEQGHPVEVSARKDRDALRDAILAVREGDAVAAPLRGWYWDDRAGEYAQILERSVQGRSRRA